MLRNKKLRFLWETGDWNGKYRNPEDYGRNMQPRQQRNWIHMSIWLLLEQMFQSSPRVDWLQPTVTPFSKDILPMDDVEIGDVTIAYDDPRSGQTYILVICNALLIPSMEHNLIPPFLIREAELFLDETPKFMQWTQQWQIIGSLIVRLACIYLLGLEWHILLLYLKPADTQWDWKLESMDCDWLEFWVSPPVLITYQ